MAPSLASCSVRAMSVAGRRNSPGGSCSALQRRSTIWSRGALRLRWLIARTRRDARRSTGAGGGGGAAAAVQLVLCWVRSQRAAAREAVAASAAATGGGAASEIGISKAAVGGHGLARQSLAARVMEASVALRERWSSAASATAEARQPGAASARSGSAPTTDGRSARRPAAARPRDARCSRSRSRSGGGGATGQEAGSARLRLASREMMTSRISAVEIRPRPSEGSGASGKSLINESSPLSPSACTSAVSEMGPRRSGADGGSGPSGGSAPVPLVSASMRWSASGAPTASMSSAARARGVSRQSIAPGGTGGAGSGGGAGGGGGGQPARQEVSSDAAAALAASRNGPPTAPATARSIRGANLDSISISSPSSRAATSFSRSPPNGLRPTTA
eukprot:scaffold86484_cov54-Phaeocystis_antarctica.AAC.6